MERFAVDLAELVPEADIRFGHGQMPEAQLERVMQDFYHQRFNVLICSTIIESGLDIPSANTIIIHRADRFGLAQLHQLRGRVGQIAPPSLRVSANPQPRPNQRRRQKALGRLRIDGRTRRRLRAGIA